jgi:hypothetical protein
MARGSVALQAPRPHGGAVVHDGSSVHDSSSVEAGGIEMFQEILLLIFNF